MDPYRPNHFDVSAARSCLHQVNAGTLHVSPAEHDALLLVIKAFGRAGELSACVWELAKRAFLKQRGIG